MRRLFSLLLILFLSACGGNREDFSPAANSVQAPVGTVRLRTGPIHSKVGLSQQSIGGERFLVHHTAEALLIDDQNSHGDIYLHDLVDNRCELISRADNIQTNGASEWATVSRDGRYVAYESAATNLVSGDTNGRKDAFLYDRVTRATRLISRGPTGVPGNGDSYDVQVSANGKVVAFASRASNLVDNDTNGLADVFLYDIGAKTLMRVSLTASGTQVSGSDCDQPTVYEDGNFVVYVSSGTNLPGANGVPQIYATRPKTGKVWLASRNSSNESANGTCAAPTFGGRTHLTFTSTASNLDVDDTNGVSDVFVVTKDSLVPFLASRDNGGTPLTGNSRDSVLSADGTKLAFVTETGGLDHDFGIATRVVLRDLGLGTNMVVSDPVELSDGLGITASGAFVAFATITSHGTAPNTAEASLFGYDTTAPGVQPLECPTCDFPAVWPGMPGRLDIPLGLNAEPQSLIAGDLNGDGHEDLVVVSLNFDRLLVLMGDGAGGFSGPVEVGVGAFSSVGSLAVGLLNADPHQDLVVTNPDQNTVSVLLGDGSGGFGPPTVFETGSVPGEFPGTGRQPNAVQLGDFNEDGHLDLVTSNRNSENLSLLLGDGAGGFSMAVHFAVGQDPAALVVDDFNEDEDLDLAVVNTFDDNVSVLLGDGAGGFSAAASFGVGSRPVGLTVVDVNGDTDLDLVTTNFLGDSVSVLLGNGSGAFGLSTTFPTGGEEPTAAAAGHFNGDGFLDLMVANSDSNFVSLLPGDGAGGFGAPVHRAAAFGPNSFAQADFNSDGRPDLACAGFTRDEVSVFFSDDESVFGFAAFPAGGALDMVLGDFDGDGVLDVATADRTGDRVTVLKGDGAGGFGTPVSFSVANEPISIESGDLDCDGVLDLVVAHSNSASVTILLGDGIGAFAPASPYSFGADTGSVSLGDVNGDGILDLAGGNEDVDTVSVALGDGNGGFEAPSSFAVGDSPTALVLGDLNRDGHLDIVVANNRSDDLSILLGDGLGAFGSATHFLAGEQPESVTLGDLNSDGYLDVAVGNDVSFAVTVFLGTGTGSLGIGRSYGVFGDGSDITMADLNGDGHLDVITSDPLILLGDGSGLFSGSLEFEGEFPRGLGVADVDGDGDLDLVTAGSSVAVHRNRACP